MFSPETIDNLCRVVSPALQEGGDVDDLFYLTRPLWEGLYKGLYHAYTTVDRVLDNADIWLDENPGVVLGALALTLGVAAFYGTRGIISYRRNSTKSREPVSE